MFVDQGVWLASSPVYMDMPVCLPIQAILLPSIFMSISISSRTSVLKACQVFCVASETHQSSCFRRDVQKISQPSTSCGALTWKLRTSPSRHAALANLSSVLNSTSYPESQPPGTKHGPFHHHIGLAATASIAMPLTAPSSTMDVL